MSDRSRQLITLNSYLSTNAGWFAIQRQREREDRPAARPVGGPDPPAVRRHNRAADRQPQSHATLCRFGAVEFVKDLLLVAGRYPWPAVGYADRQHIVAAA